MGIAPNIATDLYIEGPFAEENATIITSLIRINTIHYQPPDSHLFASKAHVANIHLFIPLPSGLREKEYQRLEKELDKLTKQMVSLRERLNNPAFIERAPKELVESSQKTLQEMTDKIAEMESKRQRLG
jgi:valyl-tRNA synthetase